MSKINPMSFCIRRFCNRDLWIEEFKLKVKRIHINEHACLYIFIKTLIRIQAMHLCIMSASTE